MSAVQAFADFSNGFKLIRSFHDPSTDRFFLRIAPTFAACDQQRQLILRVESLDFSWWIEVVIPEPCLVPVAVIDDGSALEFLLQAVCIQRGLLLPDTSILL